MIYHLIRSEIHQIDNLLILIHTDILLLKIVNII